MTDLDTRCPYQDDELREAYRRGLEAAEAGEGIDEHGPPYVGEERLLAFIEGYVYVRGPL
jgi:hypothetical protein